MKRLLAILILISLLMSMAACAKQDGQAAEEETLPWWQDMLKDPNAIDYDSIDENVPENGEYQIHTAEGLKNIAKYPDANFKILRSIDLQGAEWTPVENFTGRLNGQSFVISNFTISTPTKDGNLAFIATNKGQINNMNLQNVTITTNEQTVNVGGLVAVNQGTMRRNVAGGTITIEKVAEGFNCGGAVAVNKKTTESQTGAMNIVCSATAKGNIGGLVGTQESGKLQYSTAEGDMTVKNSAGKLVGMFCGKANNVDMVGNAFAGAVRTVDGVQLEAFCGAEEAVTNTEWSLRDSPEPLSAVVLEKRQRVVDEINAMASIEWSVSEPITLDFDCSCCTKMTLMPGVPYRGIIYNHKSGSLTRFKYCLDENNTIADWCYDAAEFDGWDVYIGNDCSTAVQQALAVVCNDCDFMRARDQFPGLGYGTTLPVGDWVWDIPEADIRKSTKAYIDATGIEKMYEAYAQLRLGDCLGSIVAAGGHCRIATTDPVVMRGADGKIDPDKSYIIKTDQVANFTWRGDGSYMSSWNYNQKTTFRSMAEETFIVPLTWAELNSEEPIATPQITVEDGVDGRFGMTTGIVTSNVYLESVTLVITDEAGNEMFNHVMFANAERRGDVNDPEAGLSEDRAARKLPKTFDLARFGVPIRDLVFEQGKTYTAQITAQTMSGFDVVVKELNF